ncbi:secretion protein EspS [Citrobacter braakii]|uniref:secretion protein EspS n=1 Tax=Citrobacter braakii TaxID=57706 RepID=UPI00190758F0|nr:secretion protein EspS [Citrobacter braakii]MBJ9238053.1 secretion protein EspS [Citrobacter braakii]
MFSIGNSIPVSANTSIPTNGTNRVEAMMSSNRKLSVLPEKEGLLVFLGKQSVKEHKLHILGQNIPRVFSGKPLYDLLFLTPDVKQEFDNSKQEIITGNTDRQNLQSNDLDMATGVAVGLAARETITLLPEDVAIEKYRKIYVLGESYAGLPVLKCGDELLLPKDIVDRLQQHNLLCLHDIRFTSCNSANLYEIKNFTSEELNSSRESKRGWLAKLLFGDKASLITHVSKELEKRELNAKITGYHGTGVFYVPEIGRPTTHLRSTTVPATPEQIVRRSDYKATIFTNPKSEID